MEIDVLTIRRHLHRIRTLGSVVLDTEWPLCSKSTVMLDIGSIKILVPRASCCTIDYVDDDAAGALRGCQVMRAAS